MLMFCTKSHPVTHSHPFSSSSKGSAPNLCNPQLLIFCVSYGRFSGPARLAANTSPSAYVVLRTASSPVQLPAPSLVCKFTGSAAYSSMRSTAHHLPPLPALLFSLILSLPGSLLSPHCFSFMSNLYLVASILVRGPSSLRSPISYFWRFPITAPL